LSLFIKELLLARKPQDNALIEPYKQITSIIKEVITAKIKGDYTENSVLILNLNYPKFILSRQKQAENRLDNYENG
jgi:hypothetical protein